MGEADARPLELGYSTVGSGQLNWQREGELLLINIVEPRGASARVNWRVVLGVWVVVAVGMLTAMRLMQGPGRSGEAMEIVGGVVFLHVIVILVGLTAGQRKLMIRLSRKKLLVDEYDPKRNSSSGVRASISGRAWEAGEVESVVAKGGTFRVRGKGPGSISFAGYDAGDVAFAAEAVRKVLEGGAEAWERSRREG